MGLTNIQKALARLYTDAALRGRFFEDPQGVGQALRLSPNETHQLARLSAQQVAFFAGSLKRKRLNEVRRLLPLTHRALGKRFIGLFQGYANTWVPDGMRRHQRDALAFAIFVDRTARTEDIGPPWVADLARYEAAWVRAADPACRWVVRRFRYAVHSLAQSLAEGDAVPSPMAQPTVAIWCRLSRGGRLRHIVLSLPLLS